MHIIYIWYDIVSHAHLSSVGHIFCNFVFINYLVHRELVLTLWFLEEWGVRFAPFMEAPFIPFQFTDEWHVYYKDQMAMI
jgi:hypothetical protein